MEHTENYQSFMERAEVLYPHHDCVRISIAYKLSKFEHRAQVRKSETNDDGTPVRYFEHARRVALIGMDEALFVDSELTIISLLHDTIEDTRLSPEEITAVFGPDVSQQVMLMSKKPKVGFRERLLTHGTWRVLATKTMDRIDNLRSMDNCSDDFRKKQISETIEMYIPLANTMLMRVIEPHVTAAHRLVDLFHDTLSSVQKGH